MQGSNRVEGLAESYSLFGVIPQAAREQVGVEMAIIAREVLAAQRRDVAKDRGTLERGLSIQGMLEQLRIRIGLIGIAARSKRALRRAQKEGRAPGEDLGDLYHGRFVEFGRRAQTVIVERRRRVEGRLRTERRGSWKRTEDIAATYSMKVKAMAPRPYVFKDRPEIGAEQRLANFWSAVLGKSGAAA